LLVRCILGSKVPVALRSQLQSVIGTGYCRCPCSDPHSFRWCDWRFRHLGRRGWPHRMRLVVMVRFRVGRAVVDET
jgi:hypothetical protein